MRDFSLKSRFLVPLSSCPHMAGVSQNRVGTMPLWPPLPLPSSYSSPLTHLYDLLPTEAP